MIWTPEILQTGFWDAELETLAMKARGKAQLKEKTASLHKMHCPKTVPVIELGKTKAPAQRGYCLDQVVETPNQAYAVILACVRRLVKGDVFC